MRAGRLRRALPALLFALATIVVCAPALIHRSWWIDELITRDISRLPFIRLDQTASTSPFTHSILYYTLHDTGPGPLMYVLEGLFSRLAFPMGGEFWLRIPGIVAGALSSAILFLICVRFVGRYGAAAAATVSLLLPPLLEAYTGARGYGWLMYFALIQLYAVYETLPFRRWRIVAFTVAAVLGLLVNPVHTVWTGCMVALAVNYRIWFSRDRRPTPGELLSVSAIVLVTVLWIAIWFHSLANSRAGSATTLTAAALSTTLKRVFSDSGSVPLLILANLVAGALLLRCGSRTAKLHGVLSLLVCTASVVLLLILSATVLCRIAILLPALDLPAYIRSLCRPTFLCEGS